RHPRQPGADDDRRHHHHGAQRARRQAEGDGHHRQDALDGPARRPDDRRSGRAGLRDRNLARDHGAARHAAPGARAPERGDRQGAPWRRREGLGQAGRHADEHDDRTVRQIPARRHHQVVERRQSHGNEGRMRLKDKTAIIIGAGQSPGSGMGNGRATALRFAQEGAKMMSVDRDLAQAEETSSMVKQAGGDSISFKADVTKESDLAAMIAEAKRRWGRIDILHYNVGVSIAGGDAIPTEITEAAFDRVVAVNLRGVVMACKHVLPVMREQKSGVILMISSLAAVERYPYVAYKTTKAAMVAYTQQLAIQNAEYGIRANSILPGLMDTPMAVDTRARQTGKTRAEVAAMRDARVPLRHKMGTAWDVANAALFLASDEANFITGV